MAFSLTQLKPTSAIGTASKTHFVLSAVLTHLNSRAPSPASRRYGSSVRVLCRTTSSSTSASENIVLATRDHHHYRSQFRNRQPSTLSTCLLQRAAASARIPRRALNNTPYSSFSTHSDSSKLTSPDSISTSSSSSPSIGPSSHSSSPTTPISTAETSTSTSSIPAFELGPPPADLTPSDLTRLHRLSALNPPPEGSAEETHLLQGLNELVGLMEGVRQVHLPTFRTVAEREAWVRELLSEGIGEVVIGESDQGDSEVGSESDAGMVRSSLNVDLEEGHEQDYGKAEGGVRGGDGRNKSGRDLLEYATRRVGDYYASRATPRSKE